MIDGRMSTMKYVTCIGVCLLLALSAQLPAEDEQVRSGLEGLAWQSYDSMHESERQLIETLREPLLDARDCSLALQHWFNGRREDSRGDKTQALAEWREGTRHLDDLAPIPLPPPDSLVPASVEPRWQLRSRTTYMVEGFVVEWDVTEGSQYGLFMVPSARPEGHAYPMVLYLHDSEGGMGPAEITWLAKIVRKGYAVFAPARLGQPLINRQMDPSLSRSCVSAGDPADLFQAAKTIWRAVRGCSRYPVVQDDQVAVIGVGRGGTVALLASTFSPTPLCTVAVDAWRLNPFRFYWERMARGENRWQDWARFCSKEPREQLVTMAAQSPVHLADRVTSPTMLILPEVDRDTVNHDAHSDFVEQLGSAGADDPPPELVFVDSDVRGFAGPSSDRSPDSAYRHVSRFLYRHAPPDDGQDFRLTPEDGDEGQSPGDAP